ncbi:uncharacterized protein EI90DRAFT_535121 [Cantharellus anzutake]|uniref:uncharacterized protein n=1 Tax=Cantharellus anzutake TaxID=1750568 RepID=UPI0019048182|nr:uncharacterized protein EI90DRAFT_535121 [Cantharellus anzutake]KAF8334301.1 hypothetical protein EI90DRAFT_535121 [Cantharellus anzutake]
MSLQQGAETPRQTINDVLAAAGNTAVLTLRGINATADWCPPLKNATGAALFIFDEAQKFKENAKAWTGFGEHVRSTMTKVSSAIKSDDVSAEEEKPWVESVTELEGALQKIKSEIERRGEVEKRSTIRKAFSYLKDPGRIDDLKKDFDKAISSFQVAFLTVSFHSHSDFRPIQLTTNLIVGNKLAAVERRLHDDKILDSLRDPSTTRGSSAQACLEGTRVDLTEQIMTWCRNTGDSENRLMLLTAVAGAGKTSIALTIAERCKRDVTLLLHFFFKAGERSRPDFLFHSIALSLADHDPVYRTSIVDALQKEPFLSTAPLAKQFEKLVAFPLLHISPPPGHPMVVIIDALDECDEEAYQPLAKILCEEVPKLPPSIKFFVTSRHVDLVNRSLSRHFPINHLTINLTDDTNVQDCAAYIRSQLRELKNWHPDLAHRLQDEDKTVQEISKRAGGLFIWTSTIFRYMKNLKKDPMRTLESLLDTGTKRPKGPTDEMMDDLYTSILQKCDWDEDFAHDYSIVMGAIFVAQQPLSITAWDAILSPFLKSSVRYVLAELAPLLSGVEDHCIPVCILHQSFRDFIVDRIDPKTISSRCTPVAVGVENTKVALRCTEILSQDLCSVKGLGLIENLSEQDEMPRIPPELSEHFHYACRHIVHHLSRVQEPSQELAVSVGMFLSQEATRWVEVCVRTESYLAVDHRAVSILANVLTQLPWNLEYFLRFQEAYEAANDSVVLCRYLFSVDSSSYTPHLARSLDGLYNTLYQLGQHSEALPFIEESAKLCRQLVAVHPGSYTPHLARSLKKLCKALSNLGRHSEALPFIEESVELYRHLVAVHPESYSPDLAMSLNNLYNSLSDLGRHEEALLFIKGVKLWRQLVAVHPGSYTLELAMSLDNLYDALYNLGRHEEALSFIEGSVKLYRQLVAIHLAYTPGLAMTLHNLYNALYNLGRHEEALSFIEESVKLHRQLVAVHPGLYTLDLARLLNNLRNALSKLGRHEEALPFIEESVKILRQRDAVSYTPDLAMLFDNLYNALSKLGQHSEALPFIKESLRRLVAVSYTPDLAMSLNNLYDALSDLGRHSEALPFIEESVKLQRQLVAVNPGSYTPHLAMSLNDLYDALSDLGRHSEALPFIEESVKLQRQLVAVNPGSYTPHLAVSLNHLYTALLDLGRHSEALPFIEESVKLYRQLVAVDPGSYTPGLTGSLNSLRNALLDLGRHSDAQMVPI